MHHEILGLLRLSKCSARIDYESQYLNSLSWLGKMEHPVAISTDNRQIGKLRNAYAV
jgi:hypothetical protein